MVNELSERERFFLMRKRKRIKLSDISHMIGCSIGMLSMHENGKVNLSQNKLEKYKQILEN